LDNQTSVWYTFFMTKKLSTAVKTQPTQTRTSSGTEGLTPKQSDILQFIEEALARQGRSPSLREIARFFKYKAVGTVEDHVKALTRKGYLEKDKGAFHGLRPSHFAASQSVPILGAIPAGRPIEAQEDRKGSLSVSSKVRGELYALRVKGESMKDAGILDGDYVIVRQQVTAERGDIVVALIDGEATVKRFDKISGKLWLVAENPAFAPIELDPSRDNKIQGKVVAVQRFIG
jgi:repressor LexA